MFLTYEQLLKLSTKRLLAYKRKKLHDGFSPKFNCDYCNGSFKEDKAYCYKTCKQEFKDREELAEAQDNIRKILATREHVK